MALTKSGTDAQRQWSWGENLATCVMPLHSAPCIGSEAAAVDRATPERRREFSSGRSCARRALADLGFAPAEIPSSVEGLPIWPSGIAGSISHGGELCFAAVAHVRDVAAVGVDIEPLARFGPGLARRICRTDERVNSAEAPPLQAIWPNLIFSAKEAVYKCLHPSFGMFFEFEEIGIDLTSRSNARSGTFRVFDISSGPWDDAARELTGKWAIALGHVLALAIRPAARGTNE